MRKLLLATVAMLAALPAYARTLEEDGERTCRGEIYCYGTAGCRADPWPHMDASTIRSIQNAAAHNCALYQKEKAKAEQRARDAVMLKDYVVQYEPVPDVEWHVTNQAVTGWTLGQAPIFTYNEEGYRMGIAGHDYFNQRINIAEGALLDVKPGTFDPRKIETTVGFFHGPAGVTMPTAAIEPTPLVCEAGNKESRKLMNDVVLRCHWPNSNEWVIANEDEVRNKAITKAQRESRHLQTEVGGW